MATVSNVHVGDIGTLYKGEIKDAGKDFDASDVTEAVLIFKTPSGVITRGATISDTGTGPKQKWFITYVVTSGDITDGLHQDPGTYYWQGHITMGTGDTYHTNIETYKVEANLD